MNEQTPLLVGQPAHPTVSVGQVQEAVVKDFMEKSVAYWLDQPVDDALTAFRQISRQRRAAANQPVAAP